ncbi:PspC domain-containing protein [Alkalihalobacillus sp. CinArs1]|uniref:PspC domain-containing protein n=1 Tax=Alkalihalobacillus sp. CinArs1 TaxID=2995314 RepID=UPI0022DDDF4D|nr:PspC domain-containing protein [Alkalihalobacillus sp. CinArs1]
MKKIYKSTTDKVALGVIGGISAALNIQAGTMRFIFIVLTVFYTEVSILLYFALALLLPTDEEIHMND